MIGMSQRSAEIRSCSSRPCRSGRIESKTRQEGMADFGWARNSAADANVCDCHPALSICTARDSRTEISLSTMNTIGAAQDDMISPHVIGQDRGVMNHRIYQECAIRAGQEAQIRPAIT